MSDHALLQLLYQALRSEHGIVVSSNDPAALRQKLYAVRKQDEELSVLTFQISATSPESELHIVRRDENT